MNRNDYQYLREQLIAGTIYSLIQRYGTDHYNVTERAALGINQADAVIDALMAKEPPAPDLDHTHFFGVPGTTLKLYGTKDAVAAACNYFLACVPAETARRNRDHTLQIDDSTVAGLHVYGNQEAIDKLRILLALPEKVAAKAIESAANLVGSKIGSKEVCTFKGLASSIREINVPRIIRKAKEQ